MNQGCEARKCQQEDTIQALKIDVAVAKSDINTVKNNITEIKQSIDKVNWWLLGIMGTTIMTLVTLLFKKG